MKRRDFLKTAVVSASALAGAGCSSGSSVSETRLPVVTEAQKALRKKGRSTVALIPCDSYQADEIDKLLKEYAERLNLPKLSGKRVVLKPNIVEYRSPESPVTTHPEIIRAAIKLVDHLGASEIIVAEGPGHMRDTEYLLSETGIGKMLDEMKIPFVDLNLDDIVKVKNETAFNKLKDFYLPKTIVEAGAVVSLPKFKTHHWVGITCSMKNFFGVVPGRKYGWPKNLLHKKGIGNSIIDLIHMVKPAFAIVDGIVAMEGDGPINGTAIDTKIIGMSTDLAALDATMTRVASIAPKELPYLVLAGLVVGNIEAEKIDIIGSPLDSVKRPFEQPITLKDKSLLKQASDAGS